LTKNFPCAGAQHITVFFCKTCRLPRKNILSFFCIRHFCMCVSEQCSNKTTQKRMLKAIKRETISNFSILLSNNFKKNHILQFVKSIKFISSSYLPRIFHDVNFSNLLAIISIPKIWFDFLFVFTIIYLFHGLLHLKSPQSTHQSIHLKFF
jgi:hypothetical protein